jgi:hypothetical protein
MTNDKPVQTSNSPDAVATSADVDAYLANIRQERPSEAGGGTGRLIFAFDATASRQETWDAACQLQAEMFREVSGVGAVGTLNIQLLYYRGISECKASRWTSRSDELLRLMERIVCHAGKTQIGKVLAHAKKETQLLKVAAVVFVGDAMEENPDTLIPDADALGRLGVPVFMFQEGGDRAVEQVFRQIASHSHGAYCRFDAGAAKQLCQLLRAVALYAVGGVKALQGRTDAASVKLIGQLKA